MRKAFILPLAGLVAIGLVAACSEDRSGEGTETMGPSFAPQPAACDTRDLSKLARDYLPKEYDKEGQDLIAALADACASGTAAQATDAAFDILDLVERALGRVTNPDMDPATGAALVVGLLPFMDLTYGGAVTCEDHGCVHPDFAAQVEAALSPRGGFAVPGGSDQIVSRDVEATAGDDAPTWVLDPRGDWSLIFPQRTLVYGYHEPLDDGCVNGAKDCPAFNEKFVWNTLPDVTRFAAQLNVAVCLDESAEVLAILEDDERFLTMRRNSTALEKTDIDCAAFEPGSPQPTALGRVLDFLSPMPDLLVAGTKKAGPGGNADDFSDFTPIGATRYAKLVISEIADGNVNQPIGPITVTALTANETPLERVQVVFSPQDNNGSWEAAYTPPADPDAACGEDCRYTQEEGGIAVMDGISLDKAGGYRVCATVKEGGDLGYTFSPAEVCSNGFNVRP